MEITQDTRREVVALLLEDAKRQQELAEKLLAMAAMTRDRAMRVLEEMAE